MILIPCHWQSFEHVFFSLGFTYASLQLGEFEECRNQIHLEFFRWNPSQITHLIFLFWWSNCKSFTQPSYHHDFIPPISPIQWMSTNHPRRRRCRLLWRPSQKNHRNCQMFFCLNKERYLLFSQQHWSTALVYDVLWYTMWLCTWWCFVCASHSFWCVFLPTFGSCFLQVDLPSNRSGNEEFAKRHVQSSIGRSQTLCKSRTLAPHIWDVELSIRERIENSDH